MSSTLLTNASCSFLSNTVKAKCKGNTSVLAYSASVGAKPYELNSIVVKSYNIVITPLSV